MKYLFFLERHLRDSFVLWRHFPTKHATLACGLAFLLISIIIFSEKNSKALKVVQLQTALQTVPEISPGPISEKSKPLSDPYLKSTNPSPQKSQKPTSKWTAFEVTEGDSLTSIFAKAKLNNQDLFRVLNSSVEAKILNNIYPGNELEFLIEPSGNLKKVRLQITPLEGYLFTQSDNTYKTEVITKIPEIRQAFKIGTITDSLFVAGQREKIPASTIMEMANLFGGVIDFILDPRKGDQFSILYEEKYLDDVFIGHGQILATSFVNQGKEFTALRYEDSEGEIGYYNPLGESMRKAFLRSPLDVFRISSNFNPRRRHPILNTIRAHKGTDYAAPKGTPVRATSDGRITFAGRNGSFGNLITVKHAGGFQTKYAHLSRYSKGIKKGKRVLQGEIIGYVGSTGGATGPHLHYEFLVDGVHKNPRTIVDKLPKAVSLAAEELPRFKQHTHNLQERFGDLQASSLITYP